jgi:hypothetical protein
LNFLLIDFKTVGMKKLLLSSMLISFAGMAAYSQQPMVFKVPRPAPSGDSSEKRRQELREEIIRQLISDKQAKLSHSTSKGKVFIMPPDNMPCLVPNPNATAQMPVDRKKPANAPMPNAQNLPGGIRPKE